MTDRADYDDPEIEEAWCAERRAQVADYLRKQGVKRGRIGEWPAWHLAPNVSVWAIESTDTRGAVGWWAICGDLPTDYVSGRGTRDPREAVRAFASRWREASALMHRGEPHPELVLGSTPEERKPLARLLEARAMLLARMVEDEEIWDWDD